MNPTLLTAIQQVEINYGSLASPRADLSKVHRIVKHLHMFGRTPGDKSHYYHYSSRYGKYCTHRKDVGKAVKLLHGGRYYEKQICSYTGLNYGLMHKLKKLVDNKMIVYIR